MRTLLLASLVVAVALLVVTGCQTRDTGSREFVPGQGWVPVDR